MVKGLATEDRQLAQALFRQSCFDLSNGTTLYREVQRPYRAKALAVAQFQQCCEKALKALILLTVGRDIYGNKVKPTHCVTDDLRKPELAGARTRVADVLRKLGRRGLADGVLQELQALAPRGGWEQANPEYPWVNGSGAVRVPVDYFEERELKVGEYAKLAATVVKVVAAEEASLNEERKAAEAALRG